MWCVHSVKKIVSLFLRAQSNKLASSIKGYIFQESLLEVHIIEQKLAVNVWAYSECEDSTVKFISDFVLSIVSWIFSINDMS